MLGASPYTVTFHALRPSLGEIVVTMHRVERVGISASVNTPGMTLAAARTVKGEPRADGFRVADEQGRVVLDHLDRAGRD